MEKFDYYNNNKIVETMSDNYNSTYKNYNQNTQKDEEKNNEIQKEENPQENSNLKNLINSFSNQNGGLSSLLPLLNGNINLSNLNTNELLKNMGGNKNEMLMKLLMNMNNNSSQVTNLSKNQTNDFTTFQNIEDYDIL